MCLYRIIQQFRSWLWSTNKFPRGGYFLHQSKFKSCGRNTIIKNLKLTNPSKIEVGNDCVIGEFTWLGVFPIDAKSKLKIGSRTRIGRFSEVFSVSSVILEDSVAVAENVYISDNNHNFKIANIPIRDQGISFIKETIIGEGSWIGRNVCIVGCRIGKHCVIGANSFVNCDIPDYSVAVGCPAKVIKTFDFSSNSWIPVKSSIISK